MFEALIYDVPVICNLSVPSSFAQHARCCTKLLLRPIFGNKTKLKNMNNVSAKSSVTFSIYSSLSSITSSVGIILSQKSKVNARFLHFLVVLQNRQKFSTKAFKQHHTGCQVHLLPTNISHLLFLLHSYRKIEAEEVRGINYSVLLPKDELNLYYFFILRPPNNENAIFACIFSCLD